MPLTHDERKRIRQARSDARRAFLRTSGRVDRELSRIVVRSRCAAETQAGRPCPFYAEAGGRFCGVHLGHARRSGRPPVERSPAS